MGLLLCMDLANAERRMCSNSQKFRIRMPKILISNPSEVKIPNSNSSKAEFRMPDYQNPIFCTPERVFSQNPEFVFPNVDVPIINFTKIDIRNVDITNSVPSNVQPPKSFSRMINWLNLIETILGEGW